MAIVIKPPVSGGGGGAVDSVNGATGVVVLTTDNIDAGSNADRQYFSDTLARGAFTAGTGISITAGTIASTITQYTDELARDVAGTALANGTHTGISFVNNDGGDTIDATVSLAGFSTDNLSQGSTNKYFSDTLARGAFTAGAGISITTGTIASTITQYTDTLAKTASVVNSMTGTQTDQAPSVSSVKAYYTAGTGISLTGGTIASTITQYTDADADARITAQKGQANGICELDANSLVPTNHLPPLAITDVHVVADATERLALTVQEGDVAIQTDDSTSWIYSGTAWVQFSTGGAVLSVNGQTGTVSLDTDDVTEGATNKYFSDTLARGAFTAGAGISITTGTIASTITQYTDTLAKTASVVNSMSGTETDQAPSVSSVKAYISSNSVGRPSVYDKTSSYTIPSPSASTYQEVYTVSGSSACTITLPDATLCTGMIYHIKRLGSATTTVAGAGQLIDGMASIQILTQYASCSTMSTGTGWVII